MLVDESQFLTPAQVKQLGAVVDELNIPVLCYGLRTDFRGELFPGSAQLLAWADNLVELKTICHCGRKAIMVVRVKADGTAEREGAQIEIGGNERYVPAVPQAFFASSCRGKDSCLRSRRNCSRFELHACGTPAEFLPHYGHDVAHSCTHVIFGCN